MKDFAPLIITGGNKEGRELEFYKLSGLDKNKSSQNPDFLKLETLTSIGIEEVRNLQSWLSLRPFSESKKVVFINEAQNLTIEAQNAILKTLEEPPSDSLLILSVPDISWLIPTVVSRCQIITLPSLLPKIEKEEFEKQKKLLENFISANPSTRFSLLEEEGIAKDRETATLWVDEMISITRKLMITSLEGKYLQILTLLNKTKNYLKANCNVRLTLENFLLDLTSENW